MRRRQEAEAAVVLVLCVLRVCCARRGAGDEGA